MSLCLLPLLSDPSESLDSSLDNASEGDIEDSVKESDNEESDEDDEEELALELLDGSEVGLDLLLECPTFLSALPR